MEDQKTIAVKRLNKMRKKRIGLKLFVPSFYLTFFGGIAAVTLAMVTFAGSDEEVINQGLLYAFIATVIITVIGVVGLYLPRVHNKTWIATLNEKMYQETFGPSPLPEPPVIQKDLLIGEKIEQQTVEKIGQALAFSYPDGNRLLLCDIQATSENGWDRAKDVIASAMAVQNNSSEDLGEAELRSTLPVLFQGTYVRLESPLFSFAHRLEVRERRNSISPSSFYTEEAIIESLSFGDFDVYGDDLEFAKAFLTEERKKVLMEFASAMSKGLILTVLPNAMVFEIYGVEVDFGPISLNDPRPTITYERKKGSISPLLPLIFTFLRSSSHGKS